jgi:hypothetical protein
MSLLGAIVDWGELGSTVAAAAVAGAGVVFIFSLAVFGAARWLELGRESRGIAAFGAAAMTVLALAAFVGAIVVGLIVMTDK